MRHQVASREFAHLARANQEDIFPLQGAENLFREFHGDRCDRDGRRSHCSLAAYALCDRKSTAEKLIELSAHRAHCPSRSVGFLHLSKNLRFAHDHRIQARSHAEQVPHGIFLAEFV